MNENATNPEEITIDLNNRDDNPFAFPKADLISTGMEMVANYADGMTLFDYMAGQYAVNMAGSHSPSQENGVRYVCDFAIQFLKERKRRGLK